MRSPQIVTRHPPTPHPSAAVPLTQRPRLEAKPAVRKCIEQIMRKTGLSARDAKLVLNHMLRQDMHQKKGERGADAVSFEEMVRGGEWRLPNQARPNAVLQPSLPNSPRSSLTVAVSPSSSPSLSPSSSPPTSPTPRDDEPIVAHVVRGCASAAAPDEAAKSTLQMSAKPDGQNVVDLNSSCTDGLMLLSTTAFVCARHASASG